MGGGAWRHLHLGGAQDVGSTTGRRRRLDPRFISCEAVTYLETLDIQQPPTRVWHFRYRQDLCLKQFYDFPFFYFRVIGPRNFLKSRESQRFKADASYNWSLLVSTPGWVGSFRFCHQWFGRGGGLSGDPVCLHRSFLSPPRPCARSLFKHWVVEWVLVWFGLNADGGHLLSTALFHLKKQKLKKFIVQITLYARHQDFKKRHYGFEFWNKTRAYQKQTRSKTSSTHSRPKTFYARDWIAAKRVQAMISGPIPIKTEDLKKTKVKM